MATTTVDTVRRSSGPRRVTSMIRAAFEAVLLWLTLGRERRHLAGLDDRMLRDIGITRADVEREYRKSFWQN